jgi:hypothetical protein
VKTRPGAGDLPGGGEQQCGPEAQPGPRLRRLGQRQPGRSIGRDRRQQRSTDQRHREADDAAHHERESIPRETRTVGAQPAADDRPDGDPGEPAGVERPDGATGATRGREPNHDLERAAEEIGRADRLEHPGGDHLPQVGGEGRRDGADSEHRQREPDRETTVDTRDEPGAEDVDDEQ